MRREPHLEKADVVASTFVRVCVCVRACIKGGDWGLRDLSLQAKASTF